MAAGFCAMRLSPRAFWEMTPRELAAALGLGTAQPSAPGRVELATLMRRFPDAPDQGHVRSD